MLSGTVSGRTVANARSGTGVPFTVAIWKSITWSIVSRERCCTWAITL